MKKFVLLIILLLGLKGYSQHPELLDTTWYLHKLVIENEDVIPPINWEVSDITMIFDNLGFQTSVCNLIISHHTYQSDNSFFIDVLIITAQSCVEDENQIFETNYYKYFLDYSNEYFNYEITIDTEGNKILVIINANGEEAHYGSVPLSHPEFSQSQLTLYPNPVKDVLHINSTEMISEVSVYDIHGKVVKSIDVNSQNIEINVTHLPAGMYFVKTQTPENHVITQRFLKK